MGQLPRGPKFRHILQLASILVAAVVATGVTARSAIAGAFYDELAGGVSQFQNSSALFGGAEPAALGISGNIDIFATLGDPMAGVEIQGGLLGRWTSVSDASSAYSIVSLYPAFRVQVNQVFFGLGITPLVWTRTGTAIGYDAYQAPASRFAYYGEAGVLWAVVPIFSLGLAASAEWVASAGPAITGTALMRFYFGFWRSANGDSSSPEFRGWRYPFGNWQGN